MASQNRTVTLTLNAQTNGADSVRDLASEIQKLGKKGGDAAPEFEKLAQELNDLAQRQDAVATFNELTTAVDQSKAALTTAKTAANAKHTALIELVQALTAAKTAEQAFSVGVKENSENLRSANQKLLEARSAWSDYVAKIGGAKRANDEQKVTLKELTQAIREAKAGYDAAKVAVGALTPEYEALQKATREAAADVRAQESALARTNKTVDESRAKYDQFAEALRGAESALGKMGIDAKNTAAAQDGLTQSMAALTNKADTLKTGLASAGNSAQTAAQKIASAFAGTGVQSADKLNDEILKIDQALLKLARDTSINETEFNSAFTAGKRRIAELHAELQKADGSSKSFGTSIKDAFRSFGPATLVFNGITSALNLFIDTGKRIPEVTAEFQTMERTLRILSGSTAAARKEMAYIMDVANRVGTDIKGAADGYIKLTAATKGTNLEGAQTKRIFEAVSGAMGVLGASSAETTNALQAVTQIVSKGVVSMEEMRQQLGERLPQALQATAKELGITTADFNELISSGKLTADDVLPALAAGLEKVYKTGEQNDTLRGSWAQFTNALKGTASAIGDTGIVDGLLKIGRVATTMLVGLVEGFVFASEAVMTFFRVITPGGKTFGAEMDALGDKARAFQNRMDAMAGSGPGVAKAVADMAKEAQAAGQEFFYLGDGTKVATASIIGAGDGFISFVLQSEKAMKSAEGFATSARKAAEYTRSAGEASITAAGAIGNETDKREAATKVAENNAVALNGVVEAEKKVLAIMEGEALQRAIALRDGQATSDAHKKQLADLGDEIGKRRVVVDGLERQAEAQRLLAIATQASSDANKDNATRADTLRQNYLGLQQAVEILHDAQKQGVEVTQQLKAADEQAKVAKKLYTDAINDEAFATEAMARLSGNEKQQRDAAVASAERHLQLLRDVGEARTDEYRKAELQLVALQTERAALNDNSGALVQLRADYEATKAKVEELKVAKSAGKDVTVELTAAELEAAKAAAMYSDSLKDQKEKIDAVKNAKVAELDVKSAGLSVAIAELQSYADVARAMGDEQGAADALLQIKRLEIEMARLTAEAKKLEAEAARKLALAKIEEIKASGIMTDAKRAEIAALEASVKVKEAEANIAEITADRLDKLATATAAAGGAADSASGEYDNMAGSMNRAADAAKRLREEQQGEVGVGGGDVRTANTAGGKIAPRAVDFTETLYKRGASIDEQKLAQKYVGEYFARNQATMMTGNLGSEENANRLQRMAINDAVDKAIAAARKEMQTGQAVDLGTSVNDLMAQAMAKTPLRSLEDMIGRIKNAGNTARSQTINIKLGGKSTAVNVASAQDAHNLTSIFKQLENSAGAAS